MSTTYNVEEAAELAAQAWIRAANLSWVQAADANVRDRVYVGLEGRDTVDEGADHMGIELPCVVCTCEQAQPVKPPFRNNWDALLQIQVHSQADDTLGRVHAARVREVGELFYTTTIADDLSNAVPSLLFVPFVLAGPRTRTRQSRSWVSTLEFTLVSCYPIDLSA